jgi:hypothetical protein
MNEYVVDDYQAAGQLHFFAAICVGIWYPLVFGAAMSNGTKYLDSGAPEAHGVLQACAWALGSGIGVTLASIVARSHRHLVGICGSLLSAAVWFSFLILSRGILDSSDDVLVFGHAISAKQYLLGFSFLVLFAGLAGYVVARVIPNDDEFVTDLLKVKSVHWLWLWVAAFAWLVMLPTVVYYFWLQIAVALFSIAHPSLWLQAGSDLFFGLLGTAVLLFGIHISLRALTNQIPWGTTLWRRVVLFVLGTFVLAALISPVLLNLDIYRLKDVPASMGVHPWWIL